MKLKIITLLILAFFVPMVLVFPAISLGAIPMVYFAASFLGHAALLGVLALVHSSSGGDQQITWVELSDFRDLGNGLAGANVNEVARGHVQNGVAIVDTSTVNPSGSTLVGCNPDECDTVLIISQICVNSSGMATFRYADGTAAYYDIYCFSSLPYRGTSNKVYNQISEDQFQNNEGIVLTVDTSDGGTSDGGTSGGGTSDGGTSDGGTSDGGTSDGGTSDGENPGYDGLSAVFDTDLGDLPEKKDIGGLLDRFISGLPFVGAFRNLAISGSGECLLTVQNPFGGLSEMNFCQYQSVFSVIGGFIFIFASIYSVFIIFKRSD